MLSHGPVELASVLWWPQAREPETDRPKLRVRDDACPHGIPVLKAPNEYPHVAKAHGSPANNLLQARSSGPGKLNAHAYCGRSLVAISPGANSHPIQSSVPPSTLVMAPSTTCWCRRNSLAR